MKRTAPREIKVRLTAPRPGEPQSDVWVVNGRVIRFLDPLRPEEKSGEADGGGRLRAWLGARRPHGAHHR